MCYYLMDDGHIDNRAKSTKKRVKYEKSNSSTTKTPWKITR